NLSLIGEGPAATIIAAPATLPVSFYRDIQYLPLVYAHDAANVVIKNLSADGNTFESATAAFAGIAYSQAGGLVDNVKISTAPNMVPYSKQLGYGFLANADNNTARNITLSNSTIISYQRFAAGFLGKDLTALADGNTILGAGKTDAVTQNGVLISLQASGTIKNNTIKNFMFTGGNLTAIGIYAIDTRPVVTITGNQLTDCQTAIFCINSTGTQITQNRIVFNGSTYDDDIDYSWGILVENGNYTVSQNEIDGRGKGTGIDAFSLANETTILNATYNIVKNVETGISVEVDEEPGCATGEIHYNSITGALEPLYNNQEPTAECPVPDDECNWLGSANEDDFADTSKPSHIIGTVDYTPWLTNGT
ncbi:MAG: right-handed parallel beta-helix repeat-containing protein, partial [Sphingobacteriales bacterium]